MHTRLLNMGFVKLTDGVYMNYEVNLRVTIHDNDHVLVPTPSGVAVATLDELEDAIVGGGFGEF